MIADAITLWWETMAGPQILIRQITDALSEGKSVILRSSGRLPWQEQMRDILSHQLNSATIERAELGSSSPQQLIPQLLGQLRKNRASICPLEYRAQLIYLLDEHIFQGSVIWLQLTSGCDLRPAVHLLSDFRGKGLERSGCFVLSVPDQFSLPRLSNSVEVIDCNESVHFGDVRLFASILADMQPGLPEEYRLYVAQLAAHLAGRNGELVPLLLQHLRPDQEPADSLKEIRHDMPVDPSFLPDPVRLEQLIWKAQLQTVFADIEMARLRIVSDWSDAIENALKVEYWEPQKNRTGFIEQMGERLTEAEDVELGTLVRMMVLRRNEDHNQYLLYIPDEQTREWICFLRTCRNKLAHHVPCPQAEMCRLLSGLAALEEPCTGTRNSHRTTPSQF